jgi:hypothetical protein
MEENGFQDKNKQKRVIYNLNSCTYTFVYSGNDWNSFVDFRNSMGWKTRTLLKAPQLC